MVTLVIVGCGTLSNPVAAGPPPPPTNNLYGFISSNTTLTYSSPGPIYFVLGDLVVSPGVTLTIEPGVLLIPALTDTLQGGDYPTKVEIDVHGSLVADGTAGDSVRIASVTPSTGSWGQIKVENGGSVFMRKCALRGAIMGMAVQSGGSMDVADVSMYCGSGIQSVFGGGHLRQCTITGPGSGTGLYLGPLVDTSPFDSTDAVPTIVSRCYYGVTLEAGASVRNLLVRDNQVGITYNGSGPQRISYCTSTRNAGTGLEASGSGGYILNCISTNNGFAGIYLYTFSDYCDTWSNGTNLAFGGGVPGTHMASFNPFFSDPANNNFRLASGSIFKNFSNSGREIGAYGPGPGPPVPATRTSWGRVKSLYR